MSIVSFQAGVNPTFWDTSPYGPVQWGGQGGNCVAAGIPPNSGTVWAIWQVQVSGIAAGEAFNGIRIQGGYDFTVGAGGAGITRTAGLLGRLSNTSGGFHNQTGTVMAGGIPGTGTGQNLNYILTSGGFTSTDLLNGTFYFGIAVQTGAPDAGNGTFRFGALAFTAYTGTDVPTPAPTAPSGTITNPKANVDPGKVAGIEQFASVSFRLDTPASLSGLSHRWDLPFQGGLLFSTGNEQLIISGLFTGSVSNTGPITITPGTKVKSYTITCTCGVPANPSFKMSAQLVVRPQPATGGIFTEA
jgi:hypothetical protein